jgi:hypothetical protein
MGKAAKQLGKIINLNLGHGSIVRPLGPCVLRIVPETHNGKLRLRVWGEDGVEIEPFKLGECPKSLPDKD